MDNKEKRDISTENMSNSEKRAKVAMYSTSDSKKRMNAQMTNSEESESDVIEPAEMSDNPIGAPLKKQFQLELSKLRNMTFRNKIDHIWEYYRYYLIGIAIALFVFISIMVTVFSPSPETVLFISWSSGFATDEQVNDLTHELELLLTDEDKYERVEIIFFVTVEGDPMMEVANIQRLVAMVAAGMVDVFILDEQMLIEYSMNGFVQPLDDILAEIELINPNVSHKIEEHLFFADFETEYGEVSERLTGISIGDSPLLTELNFFEQELFFAMSVTSGQHENVVKTIIEFFEPSNLSG